MLRFMIRCFIRYVRNTEGRPFLMLRFKVRCFIRYVRNTEGGPFLKLRFKVSPGIILRKPRMAIHS